MHKGIYAGLLGTVILFSACGYKTKNSVKGDPGDRPAYP